MTVLVSLFVMAGHVPAIRRDTVPPLMPGLIPDRVRGRA
jgi:hypothetical protein